VKEGSAVVVVTLFGAFSRSILFKCVGTFYSWFYPF
jgi:hypothetical protein